MRILLIGGKARHGKDTLGKFMKTYYESLGKKVCTMKLAVPLYHLCKDYFDWDGREETKPRSLMQELGTTIIREKLGKKKFYVDHLLEDAEIISEFFDVAIITDVRLPIEYDEIKKVRPDTLKIHIVRPELESELTAKEQQHITEIGLDDYHDYDYEVINRSMEELEKMAKTIIDEVEVK